jgi:hypothetical protein
MLYPTYQPGALVKSPDQGPYADYIIVSSSTDFYRVRLLPGFTPFNIGARSENILKSHLVASNAKEVYPELFI